MAEMDNAMGPSKRKYKRVQLNLPIDLRFNVVPYSNRNAPAIRGLMTEMGPASLHVLLGTAYYPGTRFEIVVELEDQPMKFCAVVKRVKWFSDAPGLTYIHGMLINQMDQKDVVRLVEYLTKMLGGDDASILQMAA